MTTAKTLQEICHILYMADPMHTCCVENEIFDEYLDVARLIYGGIGIEEAFTRQFYSDALHKYTIKTLEYQIYADIS